MVRNKKPLQNKTAELPELLRHLWQGQLVAAQRVEEVLPILADCIAVLADGLRKDERSRLVYVGAGTSGRLAVQDGVELLPTYGWPPERLVSLLAGGARAFTQAIEGAEDDRVQARHDFAAHNICARDCVIALSASGRTPYVLEIAEAAKQAGAPVVGITHQKTAELSKIATYPVICETGAEPIAGSTRMQAGTAQKIILTLLSTTLMVALHRTAFGRMVYMRITNDKLYRRAVEMVCDFTSVSSSQAENLLAQAQNHIPLAILLGHGFSLSPAQALLQDYAGNLEQIFIEKELTAGF